jgi:micrococcal nuclease
MKKKRLQILFIALLVLLLLIVDFSSIFLYAKSSSLNTNSPSETATVTSIIDGETLQLDNGNYVRLIGIQSPAIGFPFYGDAAIFLSFLTLNKQVRLEKDVQNKDSSGRLLRYVYVDYNGQELFLNVESVKHGDSIPLSSEPNTKYQSQIDSARQDCLKTKLNLCGS